MTPYPTPDIITALAPDAASLKAGRGLASPAKWSLAGGNEAALWGLMQGSGKDPYQVRVLADGSATKCSCPSRKFPCKHALGLLFIAAEQPAKLDASAAPAWVDEWLAMRSEKSAKAEAKVAQAEAGIKAPVDEKAQAKRREKRADRVAEGIEFLMQWLADLTRQGLADASIGNRDFWESAARRMVDAQAPGLARFVRLAGEAARDADDGKARLLDHLGRLHLLLTVGAQAELLPADFRAEVDRMLGWSVPQETLLGMSGVQDRWFVAARTVEEEDRLITAITWLFGENSGRWAHWTQTTPVQQPVLTPMPVGRWVAGELVFYPGVSPLRAMWKIPFVLAENSASDLATENVATLLNRYAAGLAVNPWFTRIPFFIKARVVSLDGKTWIVDEAGEGLPAKVSESQRLLMIAVGGGRNVTVFGLWMGYEALPLGMQADESWISLTGGSGA